jgi:hypothetical protein
MQRNGTSSAVFCLAIAIAGASAASCDDKSSKGSATTGASAAPSATASASATATASAPAVVPDAISAQHVLVAFKGAEKAPKGVTRTKAEAKKRAEEVAAKAKAGTDFSELVAEYSDDPAAKERRGSVGKFTRDKMAKPFSDAAFALAVDQTGGPVETPFGFHVIKRNQ